MPNQSRRWRRAMLAALLVLVVASPASAGSPPRAYGPPTAHSGNFGVHILVDTSSYPGVTCIYPDANHLGRLMIRAPVVYAYDRTPGIDTEHVAWKFFIDYTDDPVATATWHMLDSSAYFGATATVRDNAQWANRVYHLASLDHNAYRVVIKMAWHFPTNVQLDGSAVHTPVWYRIKPIGEEPFNQIGSFCGATLG